MGRRNISSAYRSVEGVSMGITGSVTYGKGNEPCFKGLFKVVEAFTRTEVP